MIWSVSISVDAITTVRDVMRRQRLHYSNSRGSAMLPLTAHAAAVNGLTNSVRAPFPWRPSKLRLLVLMEYCPAATVSPFIPRHIEQPDSRQSAPALLKISARPKASACRLICCEPGTMSKCTPCATLRPLRICCSRLQILQAPVGATADENHVDGFAEHALAAAESHVAHGLVEYRIAFLVGYRGADRHDHPRDSCRR